MSTLKPEAKLEAALGAIQDQFRGKILESYLSIKDRTSLGDFEPAGLSAGKFCEAVLRMLQQQLTGAHTAFGTPIGNFADECRKLVQSPTTAGVESLRVIVPRALVFLYTMRNKRSIGHVGGDVDPNAIDAATIERVSDWVICELLRCFHSLSLEEAQSLLDALTVRKLPDIWEVGGRKRVLRTDLATKDKCLLLLYSCDELGALEEDLFEWCRYSDRFMFYKRVLAPMDAAGLLDYDQDTRWVTLSPLGASRVEEEIMKGRKKG